MWRLYAGRFSNVSPCKFCLPYLGILPITGAVSCILVPQCPHTHTPSVDPAPGPSLGTACQLMRNFRSFCNNFWNLHAFLNSHTSFPVTSLMRLMDQVGRQGKWNLAFTFCVWAGLVVYSWLNASRSLFTRIWLLYTLESTPLLAPETSRGGRSL